ncbi:hypothetical protein DMB42_46395 [Nonomuraea sp. WAC 01424]|nr:hypothetical protein DMB42_46395 [Nonomuraea sp. WAC 01424]
MIAVVVSLVAVVLLVLVVVALGMRSMNRRESSLPPERLKEMAEKEEMTHARSTDEFAAHEPRMANFSPDFSPIDEVKQKPVRTGQRGRRGVDEWGNPTTDNEDEEFWANIRSDAEEGGFGAGGTVAARKGASRPVEREQPAQRRERPAERPAKPQPVAAADPNAATIQAPLPQRQPAAAAANLADLVEPAKRPVPAAPSASDMADQRTVTFAAPTPDVLSILGAGAQPVVPTSRPEPQPVSGSYPAVPAAGGSFPAASPSYPAAAASGSYPGVASSGSFPAAPVTPIHGAPTSDPFPAYNNAADPLETTWTGGAPAAATSGSWPAASPDILDDPAPASGSYGGQGSSWPAFAEQPATTPSAAVSYPASYEVRSGWAVADDSGTPITGPSPAAGTPTVPGRAVSAYDDVLSAPPASSQPSSTAYETGDFAAGPATPAWPEPPSGTANWPTYGGQAQGSAAPGQGDNGGGRRRAPEQDYNDYYR